MTDSYKLEQGEWANHIVGQGEVSPDSLLPNERNFRVHPKNQQNALVGALNELGWIDSVIVNKRTSEAWPPNDRYVETLIDGHLRAQLALRKGVKTVPVTYVDLDPASEHLALAIFDPITYMAETDAAQLDALLREVQTNDEALQALLAEMAEDAGLYPDKPVGDTEPQIDRAEELQAKWQVGAGDLWQIGDHWLICADCREPETWHRLLSAAGVDTVNGVFTSPPYAEQRKEQYGGVPTVEYVGWWDAVQGNVKANLAADGSFFVNIKPHCEDGQRVLYVMDLVCAMVRRWGWRLNDELCWTHAGIPGEVHTKFKNQFEPIYHFCQKFDIKMRPHNVTHERADMPLGGGASMASQQGTGRAGKDFEVGSGMAFPGNVLSLGKAREALGHAAAFPVALPDFFVRAYSDPGDVWLDPFCGSGTTLVAAHQNHRRGLGIERLEKYCAVILERLCEATGSQPGRLEAA